jgi:uncharacterized Zn finger protein (UPF0148 family)
MAKKIRPGQKRCPSCGATVSGPRTKLCPKCGHEFNGKPQKAPAPVAVAAPPEKAKPADTITLDQIKAVAQMVKTIGGFSRLHGMLGIIKEVGGVKKFKDLLEALSVMEADKTQV